MNDWIQYHNPDIMHAGIDDVVGPPFAVVSDKVIFPHEGVRIWVVGRRAAVDLAIYLGCWMKVEGIRGSRHPDFLYEYYGNTGIAFDPMPAISDEDWYGALLKLTGNFRFGLTQLKHPKVAAGLQALGQAHAPKPRRRRRKQ
jgi:hypothetical protein